MSWVVDAAPKPHAGSSDGDTAIEHQGEVMTWSVLVWFTRQRGTKNWICDGLVTFRRAANGLLCARGHRTSRFSAPLVLSLGNGGSRLKQSTTRLKFAWLASVSGTYDVESNEIPKSNHTKSKRSLKKGFFSNSSISFIRFFRIPIPKRLLGDSLFDQSDLNQSERKKYFRHEIKIIFVNIGFKAVSYAVRFRASDLYVSISKTNGPAYAVQMCKNRQGMIRFENPIRAKIRRLGSSDF